MSRPHVKRPRDAREEAEDFDRAIAASLAVPVDERYQHQDEDLDRAIAESLAVAPSESDNVRLPSGSWHCVRCTLVNKAEAGRCAACKADRRSPYTTASGSGSPATAAPQQCGLPGCTRERQLHGFCTEDHKQRAEQRGLLAPTDPSVERVFVGATGEYACALLTRASSDRADVIKQFLEAWRKPGPVPRVERV